MSTSFSRRDFLKWTGTTAAAAAVAPRTLLGQDKKRIPVGLQLYSVRDALGKDFEGTMKKVAEMGFEGVEFAGNFGKKDAPTLKKFLDDLGLKAAGTHTGAKSFEGDELKKTIEFYKTIGCKLLIVPGDGRFNHVEKSKEFAEFMNKTAEALKAEGLLTGYHNHDAEFKLKDGDKTMWDLFGERTSKDVVMQQDMGHTMWAGADPIAVVKKWAGRIKTTHVKNRPPKGSGKKPFVGEDNFDWKGYINACYDVGGTEWFIIEQEEYPEGKSSLDCTKISLDNFKAILKDMGK